MRTKVLALLKDINPGGGGHSLIQAIWVYAAPKGRVFCAVLV